MSWEIFDAEMLLNEFPEDNLYNWLLKLIIYPQCLLTKYLELK